MDESRVARPDRIAVEDEMAGRQPLHHETGGRLEIDVVGQGHERLGRSYDPAGIAAPDKIPSDTVADLETGHARAQGSDPTGSFDADRQRQSGVASPIAFAGADIHEIDADCRDLDQGLAGAWGGKMHLFQLELFRSSMSFDNDGFDGVLGNNSVPVQSPLF